MSLSQYFDLDITPGAVPVTVHLKQYQTDVELVFRLFSRMGAVDVEATYSECKIRGTKKDGRGYSKNANYNSATGEVIVQTDVQMTAIAGVQPFEITIVDDNGRLITATFLLDVQRAALDGNTVSSNSVLEEIDKFLMNHPEYYNNAVDDVVIVDDDEPTSERNKLWVKPTGADEIQIPTYAEFEAVSDLLDSLSFTDPNSDGNIVISFGTD